MRTWKRYTPFLLAILLTQGGCDGSGGQDPQDSSAEDAVEDSEVDTSDDPAEDPVWDTTEDPTEDTTEDPATDGACPGDRVLGDSCDEDCQCIEDLRCLGLPGETVCAVPCMEMDACAGAGLGCDTPFCDLATGACRCLCVDDTECPEEHCFASYCVGCATDEHCAEMDCTEGSPHCRLDTQTCLCGGDCPDGTCDAHEQDTWFCPEDCPTPCTDGEVLPWSCKDGSRTTWCTCVSGEWSCEDDPAAGCADETECGRRGGECVEDGGYCEGAIGADPLGCAGTTDQCCLPLACTGPGEEYYPYFGRCCPGLVPISSLAPMEGMTSEGCVVCMIGCWALTCAPCGDGVCQLHFSENPCNCPEDCPRPPYEITCSSMDEECGIPHCIQDGSTCVMRTPRCDAGTCILDETPQEGQICSPVTRRCETPA